jgi:hypothetical protein
MSYKNTKDFIIISSLTINSKKKKKIALKMKMEKPINNEEMGVLITPKSQKCPVPLYLEQKSRNGCIKQYKQPNKGMAYIVLYLCFDIIRIQHVTRNF